MEGTFYSYAKKINSTSRPDPSGGVILPIELKLESTVLNPTILLSHVGHPFYNYMYIGAFSRYYYIENVRWLNGIWELECSVDVMATYRAQIGDTQQYILRSAYEQDENVIDMLYPVKTEYTEEDDVLNGIEWGWQDLTSGWYVVGLMGKFSYTDPQAGAITYIVLNHTQFKDLMEQLFQNNLNWYATQSGETEIGISQTLGKMIFDPFQYIKSVFWCPVQPPTMGAALSQIEIGWWEFAPAGGIYYLNADPVIERAAQGIEIKKHPQAAGRGRFMNCSRFSEYQLYVPGIGMMNIDANILIEYDFLDIRTFMDPIEGKMRCDISAYKNQIGSNPVLIRREFGAAGVSIDLSQTMVKISDLLRLGTSTGVSVAAASNNPAVIGGMLADFADIFSPNFESIGGNSGFINIAERRNPFMISRFHLIADENNVDMGRPLCKVRKPSLIPGYMLCTNVEMAIPGTKSECDKIKTYMEGGFFYE